MSLEASGIGQEYVGAGLVERVGGSGWDRLRMSGYGSTWDWLRVSSEAGRIG